MNTGHPEFLQLWAVVTTVIFVRVSEESSLETPAPEDSGRLVRRHTLSVGMCSFSHVQLFAGPYGL